MRLGFGISQLLVGSVQLSNESFLVGQRWSAQEEGRTIRWMTVSTLLLVVVVVVLRTCDACSAPELMAMVLVQAEVYVALLDSTNGLERSCSVSQQLPNNPSDFAC